MLQISFGQLIRYPTSVSNNQPKKNFTLGQGPRFLDALPWLKSDQPIKEHPIRSVTEPEKVIGGANCNEEMNQKDTVFTMVLHSLTTITQIMAKPLQSHIMTKGRQGTQDVTSN